jgi:hypothetical protein
VRHLAIHRPRLGQTFTATLSCPPNAAHCRFLTDTTNHHLIRDDAVEPVVVDVERLCSFEDPPFTGLFRYRTDAFDELGGCHHQLRANVLHHVEVTAVHGVAVGATYEACNVAFSEGLTVGTSTLPGVSVTGSITGLRH